MNRLATALAVSIFTAAPLLAGPPWISIEYPTNPFHADTRGAIALVHTFHHGTAVQYPVSARAEGIVKGRRVSVPLQVRATYRPGVWAIRGDLPENGTAWVIVATMNAGSAEASASALLGLDGDMELAAVKVPTRMQDDWIIPQVASDAEVDAMLRRTVAVARASRGVSPDLGVLPGALGLLGLMLAPFGARRLRR